MAVTTVTVELGSEGGGNFCIKAVQVKLTGGVNKGGSQQKWYWWSICAYTM